MNNIDFTKNGGLPVTQFTMGFLQSAMANALMAVAMMIGDKAILYGVEASGGSTTNGWVAIGGELLEFEGGTTLTNVDIVQTLANRTYNDAVSKSVYATRKVKFVASGGFPFADLKRAAGVIADYLVPVGMISMWSGAIVDIPRGWALCDGTSGTPNLSGRFIVGYDSTNADYDTIGETGGLPVVTLDLTQIPAHTHGAVTREPNTGGGSFAIGNAGTTSSATTGSAGGSLPHENRPPYYTLAYIIKL